MTINDDGSLTIAYFFMLRTRRHNFMALIEILIGPHLNSFQVSSPVEIKSLSVLLRVRVERHTG